ncbi:MAG: RidA family protein [Chloroflexi bacterium]|nr:MAG: RidA family protein [Chloroflexota bacterium]
MPGISHFNPPELPAPRGYSHASAGSGEVVFLAGQVGSDRSGKIQSPGDLAAQFRLAIQNLGIALAGNRAVFGRHFPASTLLEVKGLYDPEAMIEIEAVAVRS